MCKKFCVQLDNEYKPILLSQPRYRLSVDEEYLYDVYSSDNLVTECAWCGSNKIKHYVTAECAGHGDYPRYVTIKCFDCPFTFQGCLDYGNTYLDFVRNYYARADLLRRKDKILGYTT